MTSDQTDNIDAAVDLDVASARLNGLVLAIWGASPNKDDLDALKTLGEDALRSFKELRRSLAERRVVAA